ncbi:hypothetical protein BKA93DRAFT_798125, partial [Sparassis latifolia]
MVYEETANLNVIQLILRVCDPQVARRSRSYRPTVSFSSWISVSAFLTPGPPPLRVVERKCHSCVSVVDTELTADRDRSTRVASSANAGRVIVLPFPPSITRCTTRYQQPPC